MASESNDSSILWDRSSTPQFFQSSSFSNIPNYFDRSLVAPMTFSQRKSTSQATFVQLPPIKIRSTVTWHSSEDEKLLTKSSTSSEQEINLFKQKYDRLRAALCQSIQASRHTYDKATFQKSTTIQQCSERDMTIEQLIMESTQMNEKLEILKDELSEQRRTRDNHEMRQLKLRRQIVRLNGTIDESIEILQNNDRAKFIEKYDAHLFEVQKQLQQEITDRDNEIKELKEQLYDEFNYQADEHMKVLRSTLKAFDLESQKRDVLKEFVQDYETNVYRARKSCCVPTIHRLCKLSTQYRLLLIIELALNELFRSSCKCGKFKRSYQTYMRLHKK